METLLPLLCVIYKNSHLSIKKDESVSLPEYSFWHKWNGITKALLCEVVVQINLMLLFITTYLFKLTVRDLFLMWRMYTWMKLLKCVLLFFYMKYYMQSSLVYTYSHTQIIVYIEACFYIYTHCIKSTYINI